MNGLITRKEFGTMVDRFFGDVWNEFSPPSLLFQTKSNSKFSYPKMNIRSSGDEYVIEAAVPGLNNENVKVDYADGVLTISGCSQNDDTVEQNGYSLRELHKSSFARSVTVDEKVCDVEKIEACVDRGVLTVKIPKKTLDKPPNKRIIEVK